MSEQAGVPDRSRRRALLGFGVAGLIAAIVVAVFGFVASRQIGLQEAIADARDKTQVLAGAVVVPGMPAGLVAGQPAAIAEMSRLVNDHVLGPDVARVKIWAADGTIVYSDDARLVGKKFVLGSEEQEVLESGGVEAEASDLSKPENRFEQGGGDLLEVYTRVNSPEGQPLLFEAYYRYAAVDAAAAQLSGRFIPILVGGVALLALLQLPLAWRLSTRIQRDQIAKQRLLEAAVESSDLERKRIAADLHDGVVQDLTGVAFTLAATATSFEPGDRRADTISTAADHTRNAVTGLRSLLVEIYPPNLRDAGLASALGGLLASLQARGIETELRMDPALKLGEQTEALFFRAAQEALRNVVAHAQAARVTVEVTLDGSTARLRIADDGVGIDPAWQDAPESGHFGLAVLGDLVLQAGGSWQIGPAEGAGTTFEVEVPAT